MSDTVAHLTDAMIPSTLARPDHADMHAMMEELSGHPDYARLKPEEQDVAREWLRKIRDSGGTITNEARELLRKALVIGRVEEEAVLGGMGLDDNDPDSVRLKEIWRELQRRRLQILAQAGDPVSREALKALDKVGG